MAKELTHEDYMNCPLKGVIESEVNHLNGLLLRIEKNGQEKRGRLEMTVDRLESKVDEAKASADAHRSWVRGEIAKISIKMVSEEEFEKWKSERKSMIKWVIGAFIIPMTGIVLTWIFK